MAERPVVLTLGDELASRRRRRFVGRASESELFRVALDAVDPPFSVLYLQGPAGIGKTSLLEVLAELAAEAGAGVVRLDGRDVAPTPPAILEALRGLLDVPDAERDIVALPETGRLVLLLDTYERLAPLDDWLRTRLLPRLPATALTVVAGRMPLSPAWAADPAWRGLLRVVSLRNLSPEESRRYLAACGVGTEYQDQLVGVTHGHPLGLSLVTDVIVRGGGMPADPLTPDLVGTLLRRFVEVVPSALHRRALEACGVARVTTEALLRAVLAVDDAHELFEWLRGLSFVESGPDGLFPHDLARDALEADLRWRDPERYKRVFRAVRGHVNGCLRSCRGQEQQRAILDAKFLFRRVPGVVSPVDWDVWGQHYPEPARPADREQILDLVETWEGAASASVAQRWWELQPEGFFVVRGQDGEVAGFLALLELSRASEADVGADPGTRAAWNHARRAAPARPGETVTQTRFIVDRQVYQDPSPTLNATPVLTMQRYLTTPHLAWDFLTLAEPERWDDYFAAADLPRAAGADFVVGGHRYGLFAHDFRRVPVDAFLELVTERALARDVAPSPVAVEPALLLLSQPEFEQCVRQALRDLRRPDLLERNPLLRTRLVRDHTRGLEPAAATVEAVVRAAVDTLRDHPKDDKLLRAVDRTYLRPAGTQERAAALLGLPFSTYRRHLTTGVDRVVARLWDQEVYGRSEHH